MGREGLYSYPQKLEGEATIEEPSLSDEKVSLGKINGHAG